jgi:hypothetical protein
MSESDDFDARMRSTLAPNPYREPVEFCEHYIKRIPYAVGTPAFTIASAPWLREPLEAIFDPEVREVGVQAAVQLGKSLLIEAASCIIPVVDPGPTLILQDTDKNANDYRESRLRKLWNAVEPTRAELTSEGIPKSGPISFRSNTCWVLGGDNDNNLHGRSIRYVMGDEVWRWKSGSIGRAERRVTANKWRSKILFVSQGGLAGSEWAAWMGESTNHLFNFRCPACGKIQPYHWNQVIFPKEARTPNGWNKKALRFGTTYQCAGCKVHLSDEVETRVEMNKGGIYVQQDESARRGYIWDSMLAQERGLTWGELALECVDAKLFYDDTGDNSKRRDFIMQRLAQTYQEEADEVQIEASVGGYKMGEVWAEEGGFVNGKPKAGKDLTADDRAHPEFVPLRFMAVDVQRRGFWWVVRSFSGDGRSRLHSFGYCFAWGEVADTHKKAGVHPANVFVDSGDNQDEVLAACASNGWVATRGDQRNDFPWKVRTPQGNKVELRPYSTPVVELVGQRRCKRFYFSNLRLKDTLALLIRRGKHTRPDDVLEEYLKQMQAERRTIREGGRPIWEQIDSRPNHLWDCEVILMLPAMAWRLIGKAEQMIANQEAKGQEPGEEQESTESAG